MPYRESFDRLREARRHLAAAETLVETLQSLIRALPNDASPRRQSLVKAEAQRLLNELWDELGRAQVAGYALGRAIPPLEPARAYAQDLWNAPEWRRTIPELACDAVAFMKDWL